MPDISVKIDAKVFERALFAMPKQITFAMARALTQTAQDCQYFLKESLADDFTIRTNWVARGIRITPATKKDLSAQVGSIDPFMALQEAGGTKEAKNKAMAIPGVDIRGEDRTGIASIGKWPSRLVRGKKSREYFISNFKSGKAFLGHKTGAPQPRMRVVKGYTDAVLPKEPFRVAYVFANTSRVNKKWNFEETINHVIQERFESRALQAIQVAIMTAR